MSFEKKNLKTDIYNKTFSPRKRRKLGGNFKIPKFKVANLAKFGTYFILLLTLGICIFGTIIYYKYIKPLPSITELENINIAQSSTIYDAEGNELYQVYKEKRKYVTLDNISQDMRHAIVAGEDKTFFENGGIDFKRMLGAFVYYVIGRTDKVEGTSTISQQLIRNTLIGSERKLERKVKEMYLSYKLNTGLSKEKILELYLNKIFYGHNAYGIEEAAHTFFGKSAKEIGVLESSILASLPKGPSYYSPYNHPDRLLGYPYVYDKEKNSALNENETANDNIIDKKDIENHKAIVQIFLDDLKNLSGKRLTKSSILICGLKKDHFKSNIAVDNDGCTVRDYSKLLSLIGDIKISQDTQALEYQTGRKDFILGRMLEDGYISFEQYKDALSRAVGYKFNEYIEKIKYPYFVFYVKDYIEKKYGTGLLEQAGFKIYTSINPKLQDKAEKLVLDYSTKYKTSINADNAALISIDNKNGQIVSMVGGRDYFDTEHKGNVNIITSYLQPGSSFKPFVYALAMDKKQLGTRSPIYDVATNFGNYSPKDFDGKFYGKMNVSTALNSSRNIPAIKMYFYAGGEEPIKQMMKNFGVQGLVDKVGYYGPPMALGTVELRPLDLASAYTVFANGGMKKEITPILKIIDGKGNIVEDNTIIENKGTRVFDEGSSFLISSILSDTGARPDGWNKFLTLSDRPVAAKTGTSTKQYKKANGEKVILPRNLWTVGYTPQYTTVVWVGNTDGAEVSLKGDGLQSAGPIWRDFMNFEHKGKSVERWKMPSNIKSINISDISGFLPPEGFPPEFSTGSLFKNIPRTYDSNFFVGKVDALCNGKVSEKTPITAIKDIYSVSFRSSESDQQGGAWQGAINQWASTTGCALLFANKPNYICGGGSVGKEVCERPNDSPNIEILSQMGSELINGPNYVEFTYQGSNPIKSVEVLLGENSIGEIPLEGKTQGSFKGSFFIPSGYYGTYNLTLRAVDSLYYYGSETKSINISQKDTHAPELHVSSPEGEEVTITGNQPLKIEGTVVEQSPLKSINIYMDGLPIKLGLQDRNFSYILNSDGALKAGKYTIKIEVVDSTFNIAQKSFTLNVTPGTDSEPTTISQ